MLNYMLLHKITNYYMNESKKLHDSLHGIQILDYMHDCIDFTCCLLVCYMIHYGSLYMNHYMFGFIVLHAGYTTSYMCITCVFTCPITCGTA